MKQEFIFDFSQYDYFYGTYGSGSPNALLRQNPSEGTKPKKIVENPNKIKRRNRVTTVLLVEGIAQ